METFSSFYTFCWVLYQGSLYGVDKVILLVITICNLIYLKDRVEEESKIMSIELITEITLWLL